MSLIQEMNALGAAAKAAASVMAQASTQQKNAALAAIATALRATTPEILAANAQDLAAARANGRPDAFIDRLALTEKRIDDIAASLDIIINLPDPVGEVIADWQRPNGLHMQRVRTPLGVIGVIFESRPNVTVDAAALCLKSGNAVILRGGSESIHSALALHAACVAGLKSAGLPEAAISYVRSTNRDAVGLMLQGLNNTIDVIVPRGGKPLVARVQDEARVPVFAHLEGICHVYVHENADLTMALDVIKNAKLRRTGVCGSAETVLVDAACATTHLQPIVQMLLGAGCAVRGDAATQMADPRVTPATEEDWRTEYLDAIISIRVVEGLQAAIHHIETYGSHHTDSIIAEDAAAAEAFLNGVDSAIVLHNASTQFADGGEFGFGAEIGIATGKFHARGPVGLEQLTTFKYKVRGSGQVRP